MMSKQSLFRFTIRCAAYAAALLVVVHVACMQAQELPSTTQSTSAANALSDTGASSQSASSINSDGLAGANSRSVQSLSVTQIMDILQQRPEIVVELRQFVADQLQQQGLTTQADSISDEMLFGQIASNSQLRNSITLWLRARGYVSDTELHRSLGAGAEDEVGLVSSPEAGDALTSLLPADRPNGSSRQGLTGIDARAAQRDNGSSPRSAEATRTQVRGNEEDQRRERNITDEPEVLRLPTPYNLLSLRDLYTQVPQDNAKLKRFGSDVFLNRDASSNGRTGVGPRDVPIDLPVGPDYILGSGDGLTVSLSGGVSQTFTREIDREGRIVLPEAGSLVVAGLTLEHAQSAITAALTQQYRNVRVDVGIARLRTVRVYVVGDVQRPGAYDLSSLSTPLNALYAAGGPTSVGSLRIVRHLRGKQLVREVDLYDFLLHGIRMDDERLQPGDTLLIPPAGPQVAVSGMLKRPAIYELKGSVSLAEVLADAGGTTVAAALNQITVSRIRENQQRETVNLDLGRSATPEAVAKGMQAFSVQDGDRIHVAAIPPYSENSVYLQGHVIRPGKQAFREGMQLSDVIRSYQDLLPEPATKGDIVRLVPPDLHPETIQFDVADVLIGNSPIPLQPFDTVRIFGRYELDSPQVTVRGEVQRPGIYALSQGMTAARLVRMAGGFKRDALLESADLTSYTVQDQQRVVSQRASIGIGAAVNGGPGAGADIALKPGDVLTIHQISGWGDIGASISLEGEVTYPGSYGLQAGERLSSVLRRSGGFRDSAYPTGAVLLRTQVRELEEKSRAELIRQIESNAASARLAPNLSSQDQATTMQAAQQQHAEVLQRLRSQPASGRLVIHVSSDIDSWANTDADIEMRSGDVLTVPKRPGFVLVSGEVYNASAITFVPGRNAGWYLRRAGGANEVANRKEIFVIRANGSVVGRRSGEGFGSNVLSTKLEPGDVVVVPQKIIGGSVFWRNLLTVAQISSSIAITAAVAGLL